MTPRQTEIDLARDVAGIAAAECVKEGMLVGLGTGRTALSFIQHLIKRCQTGLNIKAAATSQSSYQIAQAGGIPMLDMDRVVRLDLTIDGADEIDAKKNMIKGGGGALLREKIIAKMSDKMIVVVDQFKVVDQLGAFPLPVEIVPFGHLATITHLEALGYKGTLRKASNGSIYITDNGNYIIDIKLPKLCKNPLLEDQTIKMLPGVVETGFFYNLAEKVIIGFTDGHVEIC
jgi:ribose 5-phosphate isomerase A